MGADLVPIFGMITGVLVTGGLIYGVIRIMHSPWGIAMARKAQGGDPGGDEELRAEVAYLREQVEDVQRQLGEAQERIDFTERLLARQKPVNQLRGES